MALFRQFSAYQSWQAPACLHFLHRNLLEILLIFSPSEFWRSRFLSDRGKTTANPDGFARILTMGRRKYARQNHGSDYFCHPKQEILILPMPKTAKAFTTPLILSSNTLFCVGFESKSFLFYLLHSILQRAVPLWNSWNYKKVLELANRFCV